LPIRIGFSIWQPDADELALFVLPPLAIREPWLSRCGRASIFPAGTEFGSTAKIFARVRRIGWRRDAPLAETAIIFRDVTGLIVDRHNDIWLGAGMPRETKGNDQFDIEGFRQVLELMEKHDVRELKMERADCRYVVRRGPQVVAAANVPMFSQPPAAVPAAAAPTSAPANVPAAAAAPADEGFLKIKSPTVGTFYQSSAPGEPQFVKVGDSIKTDTIVCIVEAMKVFNQIPAGVSGTIAKILLSDGDAVEFGQPLFLVKP
jgi:acetyl-CoA carboxylase biotin carboxyl carrier protein